MGLNNSGSFAKVKKATEIATKKEWAVKIIQKKLIKDKLEMLHTEIDILTKVSHPCIIGLKEIFESESTIYLVMEL